MVTQVLDPKMEDHLASGEIASNASRLISSASSAEASAKRRNPASAQIAWADMPVAARLLVLKRARQELATLAPEIVASLPAQLSRTPADTLVSELLPLLDAIRFLERETPRLLRIRHLGRRGLPFWMFGIDAEVHRVAYGMVLVIGPANYPLFLPGVQVFQALAAGNAVIWKPGDGGAPVALLVAEVLYRAGLSRYLLQVTDESVEAAQSAIASGVDKVFFTGSGITGRLLLRQLAENVTPCVAELSGNDAAIVLPSANLDRVVAALAFGMRLNGSATCMAPRRVLLVDFPAAPRQLFLDHLMAAMARLDAVTLSTTVRRQLVTLLSEAERDGAVILGDTNSEAIGPLVLTNCTSRMQITQSDIFAPVLSVIDVVGVAGVVAAQNACPLALTTSIFGDERAASSLARQVTCGTVTINDLIVPTADPRVPFGGRKQSGFGVTRGAEGLLEMTAIKVISTRRGRSVRHYEPTGESHAELFSSILTATHAGRLGQRWSSLQRVFLAAKRFKKK